MSGQGPDAAARLRLAPARDKFNQPWRYYLLAYLSALIEVADFEGTHFGHVEAAAALEILIREAEDMMKTLRRPRF